MAAQPPQASFHAWMGLPQVGRWTTPSVVQAARDALAENPGVPGQGPPKVEILEEGTTITVDDQVFVPASASAATSDLLAVRPAAGPALVQYLLALGSSCRWTPSAPPKTDRDACVAELVETAGRELGAAASAFRSPSGNNGDGGNAVALAAQIADKDPASFATNGGTTVLFVGAQPPLSLDLGRYPPGALGVVARVFSFYAYAYGLQQQQQQQQQSGSLGDLALVGLLAGLEGKSANNSVIQPRQTQPPSLQPRQTQPPPLQPPSFQPLPEEEEEEEEEEADGPPVVFANGVVPAIVSLVRREEIVVPSIAAEQTGGYGTRRRLRKAKTPPAIKDDERWTSSCPTSSTAHPRMRSTSSRPVSYSSANQQPTLRANSPPSARRPCSPPRSSPRTSPSTRDGGRPVARARRAKTS
jgi:hypothetical protein